MSVPVEAKPRFPVDEAAFLSTLKALLDNRGMTRAAWLFSTGRAGIRLRGQERDFDLRFWGIDIELPVGAYASLKEDERPELENDIGRQMGEMLRGHPQDDAANVLIVPAIRSSAEVPRVTNQGNIRPLNPPRIKCDELGFRSWAEARLYRALRRRGDITFAPLATFVRGSVRLEPDLLLIKDAITMVVEVDGPDSHSEKPVEADRRLAIFKDEGVRIERVSTAECDTDADAEKCAARLAAKIERYRSQR